jgi:hypothetical protein
MRANLECENFCGEREHNFDIQTSTNVSACHTSRTTTTQSKADYGRWQCTTKTGFFELSCLMHSLDHIAYRVIRVGTSCRDIKSTYSRLARPLPLFNFIAWKMSQHAILSNSPRLKQQPRTRQPTQPSEGISARNQHGAIVCYRLGQQHHTVHRFC